MKKILVLFILLMLVFSSCVSTRPLDKVEPSKDEDTAQASVGGEGDGDETEEMSGDGGDVYPTSFSFHFYSCCFKNFTRVISHTK